jgi:excisionase family DNA binding protein
MDNPFEMLQAAIEKMEARFMERLDQIALPNVPLQPIHEKLITPDETAKETNLKKTTILRYARNNTIPSYKSGNRYSFKLSEVVEALSSGAKLPKRKGTKIQ